MYVRRGVLHDISISKIEAKTVNMYVRNGGPMHNYKMLKGGPRKNMYTVLKEGVPKQFPVIPPYSFFSSTWNSPIKIRGQVNLSNM